jgi:hypothetical protein
MNRPLEITIALCPGPKANAQSGQDLNSSGVALARRALRRHAPQSCAVPSWFTPGDWFFSSKARNLLNWHGLSSCLGPGGQPTKRLPLVRKKNASRFTQRIRTTGAEHFLSRSFHKSTSLTALTIPGSIGFNGLNSELVNAGDNRAACSRPVVRVAAGLCAKRSFFSLLGLALKRRGFRDFVVNASS